MNALDIFVVMVLGGAAIIGFIRGFAHEVLALLAWIVAIAALKLFHDPFHTALMGTVDSEAAASAVALALLFLPAYVGMKLFARAVGKRTRRSILGPVDRVLGGGFGILKGLLGATLFFLLANLVTDMVYGPRSPRPGWMTEAQTYSLLNATGRAVVDWVETARGDGEVDTAS